MNRIETIGSDPEFACFDTSRGMFVSLVGHIPGTKKEPVPVEGTECGIQLDNVGAEITTPPVKGINLGELLYHISVSRKVIQKGLQRKFPDWELRAISSGEYPLEELNSEEAQTFGCDPSYSIYKGVSERPEASEVGSTRSFGFHLHFGIKFENENQMRNFIFLCDCFLGLQSLLLDPDKKRRQIYGNLGDYRVKDYGVEWRVLGSGMMNFEKDLQKGLNKIQNIIETKTDEEIEAFKANFFDSLLSLDNNIKGKLNLLQIGKLNKEVWNSI